MTARGTRLSGVLHAFGGTWDTAPAECGGVDASPSLSNGAQCTRSENHSTLSHQNAAVYLYNSSLTCAVSPAARMPPSTPSLLGISRVRLANAAISSS